MPSSSLCSVEGHHEAVYQKEMAEASETETRGFYFSSAVTSFAFLYMLFISPWQKSTKKKVFVYLHVQQRRNQGPSRQRRPLVLFDSEIITRKLVTGTNCTKRPDEPKHASTRDRGSENCGANQNERVHAHKKKPGEPNTRRRAIRACKVTGV